MTAIRASLALIAISLASLTSTGIVGQARGATDTRDRRQNNFEPIYSFDDLADAHSVSAGNQQASESRGQRQTSRNLFSKPQQRPLLSLVEEDDEPNRRVEQRVRPASETSTKRQIPETFSSGPALVSPTFGPAQSSSSAGDTVRNQRRPDEPAHHWSALENYYQKLRQSASRVEPPNYQVGSAHQLPTYQVVQQEIEEPLVSNYKQLPPYSPYSSSFLANVAPSKSPAAFQLPMVQSFASPASSATRLSSSGGQLQPVDRTHSYGFNPSQTVNNQQITQQLATDDDFGFSVQHSPGISRTGGIGSGSIMIGDLSNRRTVDESQPAIDQASLARILGTPLGGGGSQDSGKPKQLEWHKLPELLLIQQQQQRVKHQQETFGAWYDHQRSKELLQEEAYCGPRNYIKLRLAAPSSTAIARNSTATGGIKTGQLSSSQLARLQLGLESGSQQSQLEVPLALGVDEYPSHMGVYNGSTPTDDNFLCGATWVNERFALTLASCLKGTEVAKLTLRVGEWNLNRSMGSQNQRQERPLVTRSVKQVHLFPRYHNNSLEHNLALLEFARPVEYLDTSYICPACQMQSRSSLRTSLCWTPVRNITLSEYFDPEGEGETKEKKNVHMIELPVRLIANDDVECYRQTKIEFFNFQHPNYICSADFRTADWRSKLNQTEYFGSGIYCNEGGNLSLVSMLHPIYSNSSSAYGYMDLSYYKPWMRNVMSGRTY